jgi:hypothetical protein
MRRGQRPSAKSGEGDQAKITDICDLQLAGSHTYGFLAINPFRLDTWRDLV